MKKSDNFKNKKPEIEGLIVFRLLLLLFFFERIFLLAMK